MKKITYQFEVVEEEARFARNDVHNEALIDFKKMHSQRYGGTRPHEPGNEWNKADPVFCDAGQSNSMCLWTWKRLTLREREN